MATKRKKKVKKAPTKVFYLAVNGYGATGLADAIEGNVCLTPHTNEEDALQDLKDNMSLDEYCNEETGIVIRIEVVGELNATQAPLPEPTYEYKAA